MPAICSNCGTAVSTPFNIENSTGIRFVGDFGVTCPNCGGKARIPEGTYDVLGDVIHILSGPRRSIEQLRALQAALESARAKMQAPEEVKQSIVAAAPELKDIASVLPTNRVEFYAFVTVLLTLLTVLITGYAALKPNGPTQAEIDEMVSKAMQKHPSAQPRVERKNQHSSKVGRNAPCPCGSGKKFKKCCGGPK